MTVLMTALVIGVSVAGHSGLAEWLPAGNGLRDVHGNPLPVLYRDDFSPSQRVSSRCPTAATHANLPFYQPQFFFNFSLLFFYCYKFVYSVTIQQFTNSQFLPPNENFEKRGIFFRQILIFIWIILKLREGDFSRQIWILY